MGEPSLLFLRTVLLILNRDYLIDQPVFYGLFSGHESIPIKICRDLFLGLTGVMGKQFVNQVLDTLELFVLNLNIWGIALCAPASWMHVDCSMWQRIPMP